MRLSELAYKKYLQNKIYLYSLTIRSSNEKVYNQILTNLSSLPEGLQEEGLLLLNHYDIWMQQFRDHEDRLKPQIGDLFIFHHLDPQSAFPREAEEKIKNYYSTIIKKKVNYD